MAIANTRNAAGILALTLGIGLTACAGIPTNRSLNSLNQPVVERSNYTLDVAGGAGGLSVAEQQRVEGWFDAMDLRYGDRLSIDDPMMNGAVRASIAKLAGRHGILIQNGAPVTDGFVEPGNVRVVLTRSNAYVPGCPDWSAKSDANPNNATHPNFGCATNSNIAAMIANPEDLVRGQAGTGETVVSTSNKAIGSYRDQAPSGEGGLKASDTGGGA